MSSENKLVYSAEACRMICNSKEDNPYAGTMAEAVWKLAHDSCLSCVEACATADAVEAAHGRWIEVDDGVLIGKGTHFECSECGTWESCGRLGKYCPNCGAKMDT
jgi:predicted molibdopterin-dependent oxidoreductase YjgC